MGLRFDIIGEIAIVELPEGVSPSEAAEKIMAENKRVRTVFSKASPRGGVYRTRKLRLIGGVNNPITTHRENGILLKMNLRKVFFSQREGTERMRVIEKINSFSKPVSKSTSKQHAHLAMVFFCGIGGTPILISKKTNVKECVGIDLNPTAIKYFRENIALNKAHNVFAITGDVRKEAKKFYGKCDFVTMPLPETGWKFLPHAIRCLKPKGVCFFYAFSEEKDINGKWTGKIESAAKKLGRKVKILETRKVLPYATRKWKVRIDFRVI